MQCDLCVQGVKNLCIGSENLNLRPSFGHATRATRRPSDSEFIWGYYLKPGLVIWLGLKTGMYFRVCHPNPGSVVYGNLKRYGCFWL